MSETRRDDLERHARFYARQGFAIAFTEGLTGDPEAKRVRTPNWQHTTPLPSADYAAGLLGTRGLGRNVAVVLRPSRVIGLECDTPRDLEAIEELRLPPTLTIVTSAPWKRHHYYRGDPRLETIPYVAFRFESGKVTADASRYFVAPPSVHWSGVVYSFLPGRGPGEVEIAQLPAHSYQALCVMARSSDGEQRERLRVDPEAKIHEGRRRESIFRFACALRRWESSAELIEEFCLAWNAAHCSPPLEAAQVRSQVAGAMRMAGGQELEPRLGVPT